VGKGAETKQAILEHAVDLAAKVGLEGLSIGRLAEDLELSKSGLFAHFASKEKLQLEVIEAAREAFVEEVIAPALKQSRGEPRVRALFERWLAWGARENGCFFVAAFAEMDDRPGATRDALVQTQRDWLEALALAAKIAVEEGHFSAKLDTEQFAFELYSIMLGSHHFGRFVRDPRAGKRTRRAFETLVERAREPQ
jgi:AcrR family transcriptional regulator